MTEPTANRLKRIREQVWPEAERNWAADIAWLCDTLQGFLDEREEIEQSVSRLRVLLAVTKR